MSTQVQDFYKASITKNWTATTGNFNVSIKPTIVPGIIVLSPNNPTLREIVRYTAVGTNGYGDYVTVSDVADRGLSGTTAQSHTIGEPVRMNVTAVHWDEMQDDIDNIVAAGAPNASITTKGLVQEATDAEIAAKTDIGSTGAKLFTPNSKTGTKFSTTEVFNGTSPTTWTDLDLSSVVGATQRVVLLRFSSIGSSYGVSVKTKGDSKTYTPTGSYFSCSTAYIASQNYTQTLITTTDSSGIIQWNTTGAYSGVMVDILAYW